MEDIDAPGSRDKGDSTHEEKAGDLYVLHLYVSGQTPASRRAIENLRELCETYLPGRYELEIIDAYQQPELLKEAQVVALPTLIKELPVPLRKLVGDLSNTEDIVVRLDIKPET